MSNNPRPHVKFNPGPPLVTQQPAVPVSPFSPFIRQHMSSASGSRSPPLSPLRRQPSPVTIPPRPRIQSAPDLYPATTTSMPFPEPQFNRPISYQESLSPPSTRNRSNHSLNYNSYDMRVPYTSPSVASFASSYAEDDHYGLGSPEVCSPIPSLLSSNSSVRTTIVSREIQHLCVYLFCFFLRYRHLFHCKFRSLDAEEALSRFQAGELKESLQEWHLLVTPEACEALGKVEVQRQSVIFEIIKSERDYVADLEAVEQVCVAILSDTPRAE
jgi:RHO1 GDP-GTP exchange protein 1/2